MTPREYIGAYLPPRDPNEEAERMPITEFAAFRPSIFDYLSWAKNGLLNLSARLLRTKTGEDRQSTETAEKPLKFREYIGAFLPPKEPKE